MSINRKICIAPMMDWTDRHYRHFMRCMSQEVLLFTEMITAMAIIHGDAERLLQYPANQHPIALQLGGSDAMLLQQACRIAKAYDYDEINLNVGCPSPRVQSGYFGARLMAEPQLVAECLSAMQSVVDVPVTVKTRIGIDDQDDYEFLHNFIDIVSKTGCNVFYIHARKAWLNGLSPKQNRTIPPLLYERAYQIKKAYPNCEIIINGGIATHDDIDTHLHHVDGVMLGRTAYDNPYFFADCDQRYFAGQQPVVSRDDVLALMQDYIEQQVVLGIKPHAITRHILGLYKGISGGKKWRRDLSTGIIAPPSIIREPNHVRTDH